MHKKGVITRLKLRFKFQGTTKRRVTKENFSKDNPDRLLPLKDTSTISQRLNHKLQNNKAQNHFGKIGRTTPDQVSRQTFPKVISMILHYCAMNPVT